MAYVWRGRRGFFSLIDEVIYNGSKAIPLEIVEHHYRKLFPMTHQEFLNEPVDVVYLSLMIEGKYTDKQTREAKWNNR